MGKYYGIVNGEGLDWKFKKHPHVKNAWNFYLGDIYIGYAHNEGPRFGWTAVQLHKYTRMGPMSGFMSRHYACQFMLKDCKIEDFYKKEDF